MMHYAVQGDMMLSQTYRELTIQYALGIAAGISLVWAVVDMLHKIRHAGESRTDNRRRF